MEGAFPNTRNGSVDAEDEGFETRLSGRHLAPVRPEQKFNYVFKHFWYQTPRPRFGAQPASGVGSIAARLPSGRRPARRRRGVAAAGASADEAAGRAVDLSARSTAARGLLSFRRLFSRMAGAGLRVGAKDRRAVYGFAAIPSIGGGGRL